VTADSPYVLAVDQGSSGTKVAVFDGDGTMVARTVRRTHVSHPDVVAAQADPRTWWDAVVASLREVLAEVPAERVAAVGFSGFMHTVVPVDAAGEVVGPALLWPDQRPLATADGRHHAAVERVRWWVASDPAAAARVRWYLPVKDYLRFRLTGVVATDRYDAGGTGFYAAGAPDPRAAAYAGVRADQLPAAGEPTDVAGAVTAAVAAETGLREGTPVVTGTGDWMATLVGANAALPARACIYLGTAGVVGAFASASSAAALTDPLCFAAATATGSALAWATTLLTPSSPLIMDESSAGSPPAAYRSMINAEGAGVGELVALAERAPAGARGVTFLPHLMGERGDGARPNARGALLGMTLAHTRADVARAVLEGTALWLRAIAGGELAERDPAEVVAVGGGVRGALWLRILAAAFDRDLAVPAVTEAALLGAALIAARGTGLPADPDRWVRVARTVPAEPELVKTYAARFDEFQETERRLAAAEG